MKTIGEILNQARVNKKTSLANLEKITKIKAAFIDAIEKEEWESLPAFPTVLGFVKSISSALGLDEKVSVAVLKRDYPPKKIRMTPKPDVASKFAWSPKLTFIIAVALVLLSLFGYLGIQYVHFISPPSLSLESPKAGQVIMGRSINVFGTTDSDAKITVNEQPVTVSDDGKFSVSLDVVPETHEISVQASSRSGKTTTVSRKITVQQ
jgi:cytoskeletal protein RodZ